MHAHRQNWSRVREFIRTHTGTNTHTGTERKREERFFFFFLQPSSRTHLLSTPPSREALRHSGGERRLCTSATVTLYFDVELRRDRRPGTEQNTSLGFTTPPKRPSLFTGMEETLLFLDKDTGPSKGGKERGRGMVGMERVREGGRGEAERDRAQ